MKRYKQTIVGLVALYESLVGGIAVAQNYSINPDIKEVIEDVKRNPDSQTGDRDFIWCFEKTYKDGTFIRYKDRSPNSMEPDGEIGMGDSIEMRLSNGNSYYEEDLNGFEKESQTPNEVVVIMSDKYPFVESYTWRSEQDEMIKQNKDFLAEIQKIKRNLPRTTYK
jgi:hypothetical protein